jgi:hypothetical protein
MMTLGQLLGAGLCTGYLGTLILTSISDVRLPHFYCRWVALLIYCLVVCWFICVATCGCCYADLLIYLVGLLICYWLCVKWSFLNCCSGISYCFGFSVAYL